jgi:hypothetical protein
MDHNVCLKVPTSGRHRCEFQDACSGLGTVKGPSQRRADRGQSGRGQSGRGPFDGAFLGCVPMNLNGDGAARLRGRRRVLGPAGTIVLQEATVRCGVDVKNAGCHTVYRSPSEYSANAKDAGLSVKVVERNRGYTETEATIEIVNLVGRIPIFGRRERGLVGRPPGQAL